MVEVIKVAMNTSRLLKADAQLNENPVEDDYYDETILQYRVFYRPSRDQQDNLESWSQDFDKLWSLYASSSSLEGANAIIEEKEVSFMTTRL